MDDANAMIAKTARWQRRMNCGLIADKKKCGNLLIGLKRELRARDDNPATVVATHDIHCDSHSEIALNFGLEKSDGDLFFNSKTQN